MTCPFYHRMCGKCRKWVCRAYFPERQPYITEATRPICEGGNYEAECLVYAEALKWREERKRKSLDEHCPFASNAVCGKPWLWICKGSTPPFFLTDVEKGERDTVVVRNRKIIYKPGKSLNDIKNTCLSGKKEVYEACPHYKSGVEFRKYVKQIKGAANNK